MRTFKFFAIIGVVSLLISCASIAKFPVSSTVPAADITATKKQDKNNNYVIELTALNLAEASRLNPPKKNYNVWIVKENGMIENIGQLIVKNAEKAVLRIRTPFNVMEIFITAEELGDSNYPSGTEITRTAFRK